MNDNQNNSQAPIPTWPLPGSNSAPQTQPTQAPAQTAPASPISTSSFVPTPVPQPTPPTPTPTFSMPQPQPVSPATPIETSSYAPSAPTPTAPPTQAPNVPPQVDPNAPAVPASWPASFTENPSPTTQSNQQSAMFPSLTPTPPQENTPNTNSIFPNLSQPAMPQTPTASEAPAMAPTPSVPTYAPPPATPQFTPSQPEQQPAFAQPTNPTPSQPTPDFSAPLSLAPTPQAAQPQQNPNAFTPTDHSMFMPTEPQQNNEPQNMGTPAFSMPNPTPVQTPVEQPAPPAFSFNPTPTTPPSEPQTANTNMDPSFMDKPLNLSGTQHPAAFQNQSSFTLQPTPQSAAPTLPSNGFAPAPTDVQGGAVQDNGNSLSSPLYTPPLASSDNLAALPPTPTGLPEAFTQSKKGAGISKNLLIVSGVLLLLVAIGSALYFTGFLKANGQQTLSLPAETSQEPLTNPPKPIKRDTPAPVAIADATATPSATIAPTVATPSALQKLKSLKQASSSSQTAQTR